MTIMVRKYVDLDPQHAGEVERIAKMLCLSESELIRRCLEQGKTIYEVQLTAEEKHQLWLEELAFMEERARNYTGPTVERTWTREDAYEDYKVDAQGNPISH